MNKKKLTWKQVMAAIEKGNFEITEDQNCKCSFDWEDYLLGSSPDYLDADDHWQAAELHIDNHPICFLDSTEHFDVMSEKDCPSFDDLDEDDKQIIKDLLLPAIPDDTLHQKCKKTALVEVLKSLAERNYKLMLDNQRGFANEYTSLLCEPGAKIKEDWTNRTSEEWADDYIYKGDEATEARNTYKLIESNNFYLRELKDRKGLTNKKLADLAGISIKTVESWFADPASKSYKHMRDITLKGVLSVLKDVDR